MHRRALFLACLAALVAVALAGAYAVWTPPALAQSACVYNARLVASSIEPESSPLAPGAPFTATWTLRNDGDCAWSDAVRLVLVSGNRMGSARTLRLPAPVAAAATTTLAIPFTAPDEPDTYTATWRLRDPNGQRFGPSLELEVEVGEVSAPVGDVVLPAVLVFGGRGAGSEEGPVDPCFDADGARFTGPGFVLDDEYIEYRRADLHLCGFDAGAELTLTLTDPEDNEFTHTYTVPEAVSFTDDRGRAYTQTIVSAPLQWLEYAPVGDWWIYVTDGDLEAENVFTLDAPAPVEPSEFGPFAVLNNWPVDPIDPVLAARGCTYAYQPGQEFWIEGKELPPGAQLPLGLYQERLYDGYLLDAQLVEVEADGSFRVRREAPTEPGNYYLLTVITLTEEGYLEGDEAYEVGYGDDTAQSCLTVLPTDDPTPLRLALIQGYPGAADVMAMDVFSGIGAYPTYTLEQCDATDPAWWPGGEYLVYATNCIQGPPDDFGYSTQIAGPSYDLYAIQLRFDWEEVYTDTPMPEPLALTLNEEWDETEPNVDADGWIVYRRAAPGTPADQDADLWVLDPFEETYYDLEEQGRAPVWSPDSTQIAFMSARSGTWQIYVFEIETSETRLVSTGCTTHCRFPAWSPDSTRVIYSMAQSRTDLTPNGLWLASAAGTGRPRQWLAGAYGRPTWSATGWIAFNGVDGIYRAHADARPPVAERYLYSRPDETPRWAPAWSR